MDIRVGIVEDQQQVAERLKARLSFYDDINIVMIANNAEQSLQQLKKLHTAQMLLPQIILMDIEMPGKDGIEATREIKKSYPEIDILIQTVFEDQNKILASIYAGASGYLLKDDPIQKYVDSMIELRDGGAALSSSIAAKLLSFVKETESSKAENKKALQQEFSLTDREMDILEGIVEDLTVEELADKLYISPHTVRVHIKSIYKKLHVHTRASAVKFALTKGLYS